MDEGVVRPVELGEFNNLKMHDGVAMKAPRCGGLTSCRDQSDLRVENGMRWVGSGLPDLDISPAAALGLYDAHGLPTAAGLNGPQFLAVSIFREPIRIENAVAHVPQGSGSRGGGREAVCDKRTHHARVGSRAKEKRP